MSAVARKNKVESHQDWIMTDGSDNVRIIPQLMVDTPSLDETVHEVELSPSLPVATKVQVSFSTADLHSPSQNGHKRSVTVPALVGVPVSLMTSSGNADSTRPPIPSFTPRPSPALTARESADTNSYAPPPPTPHQVSNPQTQHDSVVPNKTSLTCMTLFQMFCCCCFYKK